MCVETEILRGFGGIFELLNGPFLTGFWIIMYCRGSEAVKKGVVRRVNGYELSLQMGGKFRYLQTGGIYGAFDLVRIGFAFGCFLQIDEPGVP